MYPSVSFQAAALGTDYVPPDQLASQYRPGDGSALRLVPADARGAGTADRSSSELKVSVHNETDLVAVAGTAKGPIGSLATVRVGVRNDGPGALPASVRIEFTVPLGTTVVSSPYAFEREEELVDQDCRALAPDGTPLTAPSAKQPRARRYVCTARVGAVGATTTFPFTLRIDKDVAHHGGRVTVSDGEAGRPSHPSSSEGIPAFGRGGNPILNPAARSAAVSLRNASPAEPRSVGPLLVLDVVLDHVEGCAAA
ncbi:hypothetical protein [Streptomyces sp. NPDC056227]|uniref:hypothetical protein n=1 Tax=Streptomyces sp. NPDC056227 TaxID=3345753 RepID=UPI0035E16730